MSTPKQCLADIQKEKPWPVALLYGEEPFKIEEFIERAADALFGAGNRNSWNVERLEGPATTGEDVMGALKTMGLFSGGGQKKLVIVRQAAALKNPEPLFEVLMSDEKDPWEGSVLFLVVESLDGRRKFHQWAKKKSFALEFKRARDSELIQWTEMLAKRIGAKVDPQAAQTLALVCDGSLHRLKTEIEKAWLHAGGEKDTVIGVEHVASVAAQQVSHEMIELVNAIIEKKRTRALLLADKIIGGTEDALGLCGFLVWSLKNPRMQSAAVAPADRRRLLKKLIDLDVKLKSTGLEPQTLVERLILS